ncbi:MAG: hypothetical protein R6W87_08890 [Halospina sp.]
MDKSWLIDRQVVSIIKSMRALIQSEFGDSVSLTDDGVFEQLSGYAEASRNQKLKDLHGQLEAATRPAEPEPESGTPHKVYRGRVVETAESAGSGAEKPAVSKKPASGSLRVYRGQRVST